MLYQALERGEDPGAIIELQIARQHHLQDLLGRLRRGVGDFLRRAARVRVVLLQKITPRDQVADRLVRRGTREILVAVLDRLRVVLGLKIELREHLGALRKIRGRHIARLDRRLEAGRGRGIVLLVELNEAAQLADHEFVVGALTLDRARGFDPFHCLRPVLGLDGLLRSRQRLLHLGIELRGLRILSDRNDGQRGHRNRTDQTGGGQRRLQNMIRLVHRFVPRPAASCRKPHCSVSVRRPPRARARVPIAGRAAPCW